MSTHNTTQNATHRQTLEAIAHANMVDAEVRMYVIISGIAFVAALVGLLALFL